MKELLARIREPALKDRGARASDFIGSVISELDIISKTAVMSAE